MQDLEIKTSYGSISFDAFDIDKEIRVGVTQSDDESIGYINPAQANDIIDFLVKQLQEAKEPVRILDKPTNS